MNDLEVTKRKNQIEKLVSNARAIISNEIALPLGSHKMEKIIGWINDVEPIKKIDLKVFSDYNNQTSDYPIGVDRLGYNKDYLLELDVKLDDLTSYFKPSIIEKCFEIINAFGKTY
jgi:hypothetical protein